MMSERDEGKKDRDRRTAERDVKSASTAMICFHEHQGQERAVWETALLSMLPGAAFIGRCVLHISTSLCSASTTLTQCVLPETVRDSCTRRVCWPRPFVSLDPKGAVNSSEKRPGLGIALMRLRSRLPL